MTNIDAIKSYHAHIYYDAATRDTAAQVREQVSEHFLVQMGRWRDEPVGPHVRAMYQIAFDVSVFPILVPWLMLNRQGLTILVHPNTDRPRDDHLVHALWMGEVLPIKQDVLRETREDEETIVPNTTPRRASA
ncbi:MAG: aromatic ring-cleaving dioxygenase [Alphaproteobacteria bacterium]|nr:aromatic ring-cleaving dioxygenase [Alphaproteobacteria bacterium]